MALAQIKGRDYRKLHRAIASAGAYKNCGYVERCIQEIARINNSGARAEFMVLYMSMMPHDIEHVLASKSLYKSYIHTGMSHVMKLLWERHMVGPDCSDCRWENHGSS